MGRAKREFGAAHGGSVRMFGVAATSGKVERRATRRLSTWTRNYLREVALADLGCAVVGVFVAAQIRFGSNVTHMYLALSLALPVLWLAALWLAGAYDVRFIGTGSDEYRKVLNAGVSLTAAVAIFSYAINLELSRGYLVIALPSVMLFDMVARLALRKRLHRRRAAGKCIHNVIAVGHELAVADLVTELGRDAYHGLTVDHPQLAGFRLLLKGLFDRCAAAAALVMLAPIMSILAAAVCLHDRGPALFTQVRVGKDGHTFRIYKFRTMVVDAEQRRAELLASNDLDGVLFKLRKDPRITPVGVHLRRWSIDELPQLFNVFLGHMSLVGPRPALPDEAAVYAEHVRRRLVVKPGLTGLWQVNGRSDLSWEESVRLDLRYVENWSFALDLQIIWKTISVMLRGAGAY